MLTELRNEIISELWNSYLSQNHQMQLIKNKLNKKGIVDFHLDHFAVIDLAGPYTGIPFLQEVFSLIGFDIKGYGYLAQKQNDFCWMAAKDCDDCLVHDVGPQVVVADFRLEEMPPEIKAIIEKYARQAKPFPYLALQELIEDAQSKQNAKKEIKDAVLNYLSGRDWPLPTVAEFNLVREFNELMSWVLIYGRRPNHFTMSIHLMDEFASLHDFQRFVEEEVNLPINYDGGAIKGSVASGIAQGSTRGTPQKIRLADGEVEIPHSFVEYVWRYPKNNDIKNPMKWNDYFTGFVADHANYVIESLYKRN